MESPDVEVLLGMVKDLDSALDRCSAGSSKPFEAVPHILETCQRMRTKQITALVHYWLGAIEQHARQIGSPSTRLGTVGHFPASDAYWGIRLRKDIHSLRTQLMAPAR